MRSRSATPGGGTLAATVPRSPHCKSSRTASAPLGRLGPFSGLRMRRMRCFLRPLSTGTAAAPCRKPASASLYRKHASTSHGG